MPEQVASTDSLKLVLSVPAEVQSGTDVPIEIRMENVSRRRLELALQGRDIVFDVVVSASDGETAWRRLAGQTTQSILRLESLEPGAVLALRAVWPQHAPAGEYLVSALIPTEGEPLRPAPVRLRIISDA